MILKAIHIGVGLYLGPRLNKIISVTDSSTLNALLINLVFSLYFLIPDYLQVGLDPPCAKVRLFREWEIKAGIFCRYKSNASSG